MGSLRIITMITKSIFVGLLISIFSVSSYNIRVDFEIKGQAKSKKYGYDKKFPIKVGGGTTAGYHFQFIEHLRGPNGEKLEVSRIGSCGNYPNPDPTLTPFKEGVLTCFSINHPGLKKPLTLYFDKYRSNDLYIPVGLTWAE